MNDANVTTWNAVDPQVVSEVIKSIAVSFAGDPEMLASAIASALEGFGVVRKEPTVSLFSSHGRLLCEMAATPTGTLRVFGNRLGWSEGRVQKVAAELVSAGFVARTRYGKGVMYKIVGNRLLSHPDSARFASLLGVAATNNTPKSA
jgi:hypothetical protein